MKLKNNKLLFVLILIFFSNFFYAKNSTEWVIAATEFNYKNDFKVSSYEDGVLKVLPSMIMENLIGVKNHNVNSDEYFLREFDSLKKERMSLFLELSKCRKNIDNINLNHISKFQVEKLKKKELDRIKQINNELDENLKKQDELFQQFKLNENDNRQNSSVEEIKLYKSDPNALFNVDGSNDFDSFVYSEKVLSEKINCLLTGSIIKYDRYIAVTVELFLYPGAKSLGIVTEIGSIDKLSSISKNLSLKLIPIIENSIPCEVQILIQPSNLLSKTKLTIDSFVYDKIPEKIYLSKGVHNFIFECDGYKTESFSYGFGYEKKYLIEVFFKTDQTIDMSIVLKKSIEGNLFYFGKSSLDNEISIRVNNKDVLGYFFTQNENLIFYKIPENLIDHNRVFEANFKDYNISNHIEKRRRMMYISYSALICSLPFLFYSYSNYYNYANAYNLQYQNIDIKKIEKYKAMYKIGAGISVGLGVWFVGELIAYLISANKVLPVEAKPIDFDFNQSIEDYRQKQNELTTAREAKQKEKDASEGEKNISGETDE